MNWFRNLSIKSKLMMVIFVVCSAALLVVSVTLVLHEVSSFRENMVRDKSTLADVLGANTIAALKFDDQATAETILQALRAEPHVVAACVYKESGGRFASYVRANEFVSFPQQPGIEGARFSPDHLVLVRPVILDDKRIGVIYLRVDLEGMREMLRLYLGMVVFVILITFVLILLLSTSLQGVITKPILALAETVRFISGKKDYSIRATKVGEDEIGQLTDAFNQMLVEIENGQKALQKLNQSLQFQTDQIISGLVVLNSSVKQILSFSTKVATSATETATAVAETTATVGEVRQTVQVSAQRAKEVSDDAITAVRTSQEGKKAAEEATGGMLHIRQQMESIAESMTRLSEQGEAIQQIIDTVEDLAAQSNLLAVNASIEAAKAGEQGKGFAVVAKEVKSLAEQSKQATAHVGTILKDIQKASAVAVAATEQGSRVVETGMAQSGQAGEAILALAKNASEGVEAVTLIAASSQQQLAGMDQVASAMQSIRQAAAQNVNSAKELEKSARHLDELGQKLNESVKHYEEAKESVS